MCRSFLQILEGLHENDLFLPPALSSHISLSVESCAPPFSLEKHFSLATALWFSLGWGRVTCSRPSTLDADNHFWREKTDLTLMVRRIWQCLHCVQFKHASSSADLRSGWGKVVLQVVSGIRLCIGLIGCPPPRHAIQFYAHNVFLSLSKWDEYINQSIHKCWYHAFKKHTGHLGHRRGKRVLNQHLIC